MSVANIMYKNVQQNDNYTPIKILVFSTFVIFLLFVWQGNKGFSLWDEGYLWYGVQRVLLGEIPIRDFMAYDPGRYYWSAALLSLFGDNGIMSVRAAVAIFQTLGLFTALLLIVKSVKKYDKDNFLFWIISAAILLVWMYPRHKLFDISLSIFLIGVLTFLISNPIPRRYFIAGVGVGLIAVFGRNHGLYGVVGSLGVMVWLSIKRTPNTNTNFSKGFVLWGAGVATGFLPVVLMALIIPGFAVAFWESIRLLFERGATNISLPVPWPWTVDFATASTSAAVRGVLVGLFFMGSLVFGVLAICWVVLQKLKEKPVSPALVSAAFLTLPYAHFAFSRADVSHLAQGVFPLLLGCLIVLSNAETRLKWSLTVALFVASFWVMHVYHPGWQCLVSKQCVKVEISGSNLLVHPGTASNIVLLRQLAEKYASNGQNFLVTPYWPGAYALLERKSPMWENFAFYSHPESFENKEVERIKASKPGFAFIINVPLDGRDELRFQHTHSLIYQYIRDNFDLVQSFRQPAFQIYKARSATQ